MPSSTFYTSVALTTNNYVVSVGVRQTTPDYTQGLVIKYNNQGNIVAQRILSNGINDVAVDCVHIRPSGDVLVAISDSTGDTLLLLDSTLQNIIWSRNIGVSGGIQSLLVDGNMAYIGSYTLVAKVEIGGNVLWVTAKDYSIIDLTLHPSTGNILVSSTPPLGSTNPTTRTSWIYTLSHTTGEYLSGVSLAYTGITTNPIGTISCISSTGTNIIATITSGTGITSNITISCLNTALDTVTWCIQITGCEALSTKIYNDYMYVGGRDLVNHKLVVVKLSVSTGTIVWQKHWALPTSTLDSWYNNGRDMIDVSNDRVILCGSTLDTTTPAFIHQASEAQGVIASFINDAAFTYNTGSNPTHIINSSYTLTPITATPIFTPVTKDFFGILQLAPSGAP